MLNSTSLTTVLVVGFISAGFMTLSQSIGVIMGAMLTRLEEGFIERDKNMRDFAGQVILAIEGGIKAVCENDETAAAGVIARKDKIRLLADEALRHESERIAVPEPQHLKLVRQEMELLERLRRIYTLAKRVARDFVPEKVASNA